MRGRTLFARPGGTPKGEVKVPNIGGPELIFLLVIVLIVFGAGKLPDVFGQLGRGVRSFRDEANTDKPASTAQTPTTTAATDQKKTN